MKPIRILSPALYLLGEVDNYLSFTFSKKYYSYGEFQLVTNIKIQNADKLNINNLIMLGNDKLKTGIIRYKEIKVNERGEEILTVKGYTLGAITKQRITIPPDNQATDTIEADAETVMKHYVQRNCLDIAGMKIPEFLIAPNKNRGVNIKWQSRYKNLDEELESISRLTNLGWHIYLDFIQKKWIFDIYNGRDFSVNQDINPPVIFSPDFDNVKSQEYIDSLMDFGNYAIVAGQGEGVNREIITIGSNATGLDRHVIFVDARDLESSNDLPDRGKLKLLEHKRLISFQSEVIPTRPFQYERDWNLGDIVTVQNKEWGITVDVRITEVTEVYEASGFKLNVVFGDSLPTLTEKLKAMVEDRRG